MDCSLIRRSWGGSDSSFLRAAPPVRRSRLFPNLRLASLLRRLEANASWSVTSPRLSAWHSLVPPYKCAADYYYSSPSNLCPYSNLEFFLRLRIQVSRNQTRQFLLFKPFDLGHFMGFHWFGHPLGIKQATNVIGHYDHKLGVKS